MKKRRCFLLAAVVLFSLVIGANDSMGAALMLPFDGGSTWSCDQGNSSDPSNTPNNPNPTHKYGSTMEFAWDFNMGQLDLGKPVLAPAGGTVVYADNSHTAWGNVGIIDYGDGSFGKVAHLNSISVKVGDVVKQGQIIGTCGGTGGWPVHIHYQTQINGELNGKSISSSFIDAFPNSVPTEGNYYTSINTYNIHNNYRVGKYATGFVLENSSDYRPYSRPFAASYYHNQGGDANMLGYPVNDVHLLEYCAGCLPYGAQKVYVQDFAGGQVSSSTLVMNMLTYNIRFNYAGVAFPIHGRLRDYWYENYWQLGAPVTNEYSWNYSGKNYTVQWFEPSDNNYVSVVFDGSQQTFRQCNTSTTGCPPLSQQVFDQYVWVNLGCPGGTCDVGGGATEPPYYVNRTTTSQGVEANDPWNPINETSTFLPSDNNVYAWLRLDNVYTPLSISFKWYNASNALVADNLHVTTDPATNSLPFWPYYVIPDPFNISNATSYGQWRIEYYVDGLMVATSNFNLNPVLAPLTDFFATSISTSNAILTWSPVTNAAGYRLYRDGVMMADISQTTYNDTSLTPRTGYTYNVVAYFGTSTVSSSYLSITTLPLPPDAPTGLTASNITTTSVDLNWQPVTDAITYKIFRNDTLIATTTSTSYASTSLSPSTSYTYYVVAFNGNTSAPSPGVTVMTMQGNLPAAPTNLMLISATGTGFNVVWAADNET